jgi:RNA recognition motif-containing protein
MSNKVYVGNLSETIGNEELKRAFKVFGSLISASVVVDHLTGQRRGFGFVEYETAAGAQRAIDSLNGQQLEGRTLYVNMARNRDPKPRFGSGDGSEGGQWR